MVLVCTLKPTSFEIRNESGGLLARGSVESYSEWDTALEVFLHGSLVLQETWTESHGVLPGGYQTLRVVNQQKVSVLLSKRMQYALRELLKGK